MSQVLGATSLRRWPACPLLGLVPKRRAAVLIDVAQGHTAQAWPAAIQVAESFYFKPDAGLLLSPADETPSAPCDARPTNTTLPWRWRGSSKPRARQSSACAAAGQGCATWWPTRRRSSVSTPLRRASSGSRGTGGYGIQTAPAMARAAAALAMAQPLLEDLATHEVQTEALSPSRLGLRAP